jgi:hypothetical protein
MLAGTGAERTSGAFRVMNRRARIASRRKSNPGILMMETIEDWVADNIPGPLSAARDRRILVKDK